MPANILTAIINADSKGFTAGTNAAEKSVNKLTRAVENDTLSLKEQEAVLKRLKLQLASLSNIQVKSSIGKEIKSDIGIAQNEIAKLKIANEAAGSSFGAISKGASGAFSVLRQAAFILPGIGIAGILGGITSLIGGLFKTGEEASKADKEVQKLLVSVSSISSEAGASTAGESAQVNALAGVVLNLNKSYKERNNALNELKGINKSYFGDLTLEASSLALLKTRVGEYSKALINQAIVKKFVDKIADVSVAISEQTALLGKAGAEVGAFNRKIANSPRLLDEFGNELAMDVDENINPVIKAFKKQGDVVNSLVAQSVNLRKALNAAVEAGAKFDLGGDNGGGAKTAVDNVLSEAKRLADFLNKNTQFQVAFEVDETKSEANNIAAARRFIEKAKSFIKDQTPEFKFKPLLRADFDDHPVKAALAKTFKAIQEQIAVESTVIGNRSAAEVKKAFVDSFARSPLAIKTQIELQAAFDRDKLKKSAEAQMFGFTIPLKDALGNDLFTKAEQQAQQFAGTINGVLNPAFQNLFTAIQSGENPLKAFFKGIGDAVVQLIQKLIAAAIQAAILSALFPGGVGGAKGFGAIFGKIAGFAGGGIVTGPTLAMVGEGIGTTRSNPEVIAPLDQLRGMLAGLSGGGQREIVFINSRIRGNDLQLSANRTNRQNRRLGG